MHFYGRGFNGRLLINGNEAGERERVILIAGHGWLQHYVTKKSELLMETAHFNSRIICGEEFRIFNDDGK